MSKPGNHVDDQDKLILFMAQLGWTYGKYDDQCFHVFDSSGNNTMTLKTAKELKKQLDQYYADFYRNKILEARIDEIEGLRLQDWTTGTKYLHDRLNKLTTQLNSKDSGGWVKTERIKAIPCPKCNTTLASDDYEVNIDGQIIHNVCPPQPQSTICDVCNKKGEVDG